MFIQLLIIALASPTAGAQLSESETARLRQALMVDLAQGELLPVKSLGGSSKSQRQTDAINEILAELAAVNAPACQVGTPRVASWQEVTSKNLSRQGYSLDFTTSSSEGRGALRSALRVNKGASNVSLNSVLGTLTSEFQSPGGKDLTAPVKVGLLPIDVEIQRHYYAADLGEMKEISRLEPAKPLALDGQKTIKKCLLIQKPWICNNLRYRIVQLSEGAYAVITSEAKENQLPLTGLKVGQEGNFFSGFTAVTVVRDLGDAIEVFDTNHFNTEGNEHTDDLKDAITKGVLDKVVANDIRVLKGRLPGAQNACGEIGARPILANSQGSTSGAK